MSWQFLSQFPSNSYSNRCYPLFVLHGPFARDGNKVIYCTEFVSYVRSFVPSYQNGIFEYDINNDIHKIIKSWDNISYYPTRFTSIYNPTNDTIIVVGGNDAKIDYQKMDNSFRSIFMYNMKNGSTKIINFPKVGENPRLLLTNNDQFLHIIGGSSNNDHIICDLSSNQTKCIHKFDVRQRTGHGLIFNKRTNYIYLFGGVSNHGYMDDFFVGNFNRVENICKWQKIKKRTMLMKLYNFGYLLYDHRIIITFGGSTRSHGTKANYNNGDVDSIFYIDLFGDNCWKESKLKCPKKGACNAVIINKTVHIMPFWGRYADHVCIDISSILPKKLLKESFDSNDNNDMKYNEYGDKIKCSFCNESILPDDEIICAKCGEIGGCKQCYDSKGKDGFICVNCFHFICCKCWSGSSCGHCQQQKMDMIINNKKLKCVECNQFKEAVKTLKTEKNNLQKLIDELLANQSKIQNENKSLKNKMNALQKKSIEQ
eukprot:58615_1